MTPITPWWKAAGCCWGWSLWRFIRDRDAVLVVMWSDYLPGIPHMQISTRSAIAGVPREEIAPDSPKQRGCVRGLWHALRAKWVRREM